MKVIWQKLAKFARHYDHEFDLMNLSHEAPNVITEVLLRHLVHSGYQTEVVSQVNAERKAANWYGQWTVNAISPDGRLKKLLVPSRNNASASDEINIRLFKTANGLISFLYGLGYTRVEIPMVKGVAAIHTMTQQQSADDPTS